MLGHGEVHSTGLPLTTLNPKNIGDAYLIVKS
jgi:hypothetical protein